MVSTMKRAVFESSTTRIFFLLMLSFSSSATEAFHQCEGEVGEVGQRLRLAHDGGGPEVARLLLHFRRDVRAQHDHARAVVAAADLPQQLEAAGAAEAGDAHVEDREVVVPVADEGLALLRL